MTQLTINAVSSVSPGPRIGALCGIVAFFHIVAGREGLAVAGEGTLVRAAATIGLEDRIVSIPKHLEARPGRRAIPHSGRTSSQTGSLV